MQFHLVRPPPRILKTDSGESQSPYSGEKLLHLQDSSSLMQVGKQFILSTESNIKVKQHDVSTRYSLYVCMNASYSPSLVDPVPHSFVKKSH